MKKMAAFSLLVTLGLWVSAQQRSPEMLFKQWDKNKDGKLSAIELQFKTYQGTR